MKKILEFILIAFLSVSLLSSCKGMLDEVNYGNPTAEEMFEAEENVVLLVGQAYADVKWLHDHWGYWGVASLTADECLCPVRMPGEHWSDGGYWRNLNTHTWTPLASAFKNIWDTTISGAVLCNKLLATLNDNKASMSEKVYNQYVGELEVLRSYYYYMLFDCFGRIPYLEEFVTTDAPLMEAPMVWSKLVACLEKNAPN
ncbi:MAG TPA: RagB/SusD family nutrient uptake outer membrane protein, partial [Candidatus Cryptobacteroides sp.]|nr:RagB/SusD family nutrient uptake outer membrane protein [Candidatus Cryptobacteroides sp.]